MAQMKECPKCGHVLALKVEQLGPDSECPRCGVIFRKYEEHMRKLQEASTAKGIVEDLNWSQGAQFGSDERLTIDGPSQKTVFSKWGVSWKFYSSGENLVYRYLRVIAFLTIISLIALSNCIKEARIVDHPVSGISPIRLALGLVDVIFGGWLLADTYQNWKWVEPTWLESHYWMGRIFGEYGIKAIAYFSSIFFILSGLYLFFHSAPL